MTRSVMSSRKARKVEERFICLKKHHHSSTRQSVSEPRPSPPGRADVPVGNQESDEDVGVPRDTKANNHHVSRLTFRISP
jgi:hypothetical protein